MRFLIPAAVVTALLLPTAALACPNCIVHGSVREDKAWTEIVGRKNPVIPAPATASAKTSAKAPAKAPLKPKVELPTKTSKR